MSSSHAYSVNIRQTTNWWPAPQPHDLETAENKLVAFAYLSIAFLQISFLRATTSSSRSSEKMLPRQDAERKFRDWRLFHAGIGESLEQTTALDHPR